MSNYTCPECGSIDIGKERSGAGQDTGDRICRSCGYVGLPKEFVKNQEPE